MERILDAGGDPSRFCVLFAASNLILERRDTRAAEDNEIIRQRLAFLITKIGSACDQLRCMQCQYIQGETKMLDISENQA